MTKAVESGHAEAAHRGVRRPPPGPHRPRRGGRGRRQQVHGREPRAGRRARHRQRLGAAPSRSPSSSKIRAERDDVRRARPRSTPSPRAPRGDGNLLALCIDAARARATVGEMSDAMEDGLRPPRRRGPHHRGVYGNSYAGDEGFAGHPARIDAFAAARGPPAPHARGEDGPGRPRPRRQGHRHRLRRPRLRRRRRRRCSRPPPRPPPTPSTTTST